MTRQMCSRALCVFMCLLLVLGTVFGCASTAGNTNKAVTEMRELMALDGSGPVFKYPVPANTPQFTEWPVTGTILWQSKDTKVTMIVLEWSRVIEEKGQQAQDVWGMVTVVDERTVTVAYTPISLIHILKVKNGGELVRFWNVQGATLVETDQKGATDHVQKFRQSVEGKKQI